MISLQRHTTLVALAGLLLGTLVYVADVSAHGGVSRSGSTIRYSANDPGSKSRAVLSEEPNAIEISDPTALGGIDPGNCIPITEHRVRCSSAGIDLVAVSVGPEPDSVTSELSRAASLHGGFGNDVLTGGPGDDRLNGDSHDDQLAGGPGNDQLIDTAGRDVLDGGPGDDHLRSSDGTVDRLSCGDGVDTVVADSADLVEDEALGACESVQRVLPSDLPPADATPPRDSTAPVLTALRVRPASFRLSRRRKAVRVSWRLTEAARVTFTLRRCRRPGCRRLHAFARRGRTGRNSTRLGVRIRGKRLRPGRYRLTAFGRDAAGTRSAAKSAVFRVLRRRRV